MLLIGIWIALQATCHLSAAADEDLTPLFNGKDLQGWVAVGTTDAFVVRDRRFSRPARVPILPGCALSRHTRTLCFVLNTRPKAGRRGFLLHAPFDGPASKLGFKIHLRHEQKAYGLRSPGHL